MPLTGTAAYALGSIGTGVFSTVPTVLLLYFCTEVLHIPPAMAALIVMIPKAWSVVWDPFVGAWSDRHQGRFGRRRPFLLLGNAGIAVSFILVFSPPALGLDLRFFWVLATYFTLVTTYSLFAVPYIALPAELAESREGRQRLVSWRIAFGLAGVLIGASLSPYLIAWFGGGEPGYAAMARIVAAICAAAMLGPFFMMRGRDKICSTHKVPLLQQLKLAGASRAFRGLCLSYFLQIAAVGMLTSSLPYIVTRIMGGSDEDIGTVLGVMLGISVVSVGAWTALARWRGERAALLVAVVLFAAAAAMLAAATSVTAPFGVVLAIVGIAGVGFSGIQVLPFTLLAHFAHAHSEESSEATMTGVWAATEKLGLAVGPTLTASVLTLVTINQLPGAVAVIMGLLLAASVPLVIGSVKRGPAPGTAA